MIFLKVIHSELTRASFKAFGRILEPYQDEFPEVEEKNLFKFFVIFKELSQAWQIGYLQQTGKKLKKLERHPTTPEVFIPLKGRTILILSNDLVEIPMGFELTRPIVLRKGIWHGVISLTEKSEILIVENEDVTDEYYDLTDTISDESFLNS